MVRKHNNKSTKMRTLSYIIFHNYKCYRDAINMSEEEI